MGYKVYRISAEPALRDPYTPSLIFSARYERMATAETFEDAIEVGMSEIKGHFGRQVQIEADHDRNGNIASVQLYCPTYTHPVTANKRVQAVPPVIIKPETASDKLALSFSVSNPNNEGPVAGWRQRGA